MAPFQPQYKGNYPNQNYSPKKNYNQSVGSRGSAKLINTKKDGCILTVELNDQNLVFKGYWSSKGVGLDGGSGWKLYPYYDKTKSKPNPKYSNPPRQDVRQDPMDDPMPNDATDFNPQELEQQGNDESNERR